MDLFLFDKSDYINGTWQDATLETKCSYSIGDFKLFRGEVTEALTKNLFLQPPQLSGSDYSGGVAERSNHRAFLKRFQDVEGVYDLYGGYGTYGVAIRLDLYTTNDDIKEIIDGLNDYALISEDDYSELESEYEQKYVTEQLLPDLISEMSADEDLLSRIPASIIEDKSIIETLIWEAIHNLDINFEYENHSAYIRDTDSRIKKYLEDRLLIDHYNKLPLLINREWVCLHTEQLFKSNLSGGSNE